MRVLPVWAYAVLVTSLFLLAGWFRFAGLETMPPGLCLDEAVNGVNAMEAIEAGKWSVFYPENNGREGLFINLQAATLCLFRLDAPAPDEFFVQPWMLRVPSAILGTLTVVGTFCLVWVLGGGRVASAAAAFFAATSFWHINFSRIGLRTIAAPFFLVWALCGLILGIQRVLAGRRAGWPLVAAAGAIFGAGFHSYTSYRITPLVAAFALAAFLPQFTRKGRLREWGLAAGVFAGAAAVCAAPLAFYFLSHPEAFWGRTAQLSVFNNPHPWASLWHNCWKTALMFHVEGDGNWRHNLPGRPEMYWPVGLLFLVGVWAGVRRWRGCFDAQGLPYWLALVWLAAAAIPVVVSNDIQPHALRALLMAPACFVLAGLGAARLDAWLSERLPPGAVVALAAVLAGTVFWAAYTDYFQRWAASPSVPEYFDASWVQLGQRLASMPGSLPKYIVCPDGKPDERGMPVGAYPLEIGAYPLALTAGAFNPQQRQEHNIHFVYSAAEAAELAARPDVYRVTIRLRR